MNSNPFAGHEGRLRRLEWQNRFLLTALVLFVAFLSIAATNRSGGSTDIRVHRIVVVDEDGRQVYYWQGTRGGIDENGVVNHYIRPVEKR